MNFLWLCRLGFHRWRRMNGDGVWSGIAYAYPWKCKRCGLEDFDIF